MKPARIPSRPECLKMLKDNGVPEHIIAHSVKVTEIAMEYGKLIKKNGGTVDLKLLEAGALLHDITKHVGLGNHETEINHCESGAELLRKMGMPEIAEIVRCHMMTIVFKSSEMLDTWEKKLVCYADKRVNHDRRVTLDERLAYLNERYPKGRKIFKEAEPFIRNLEKEIFEKAGVRE